MRTRLSKLTLSLLLAVFSVITASAQLPSNVTWTTEVEQISPTEGVIRWHADIKDEWHIYGLTMPDMPDAPLPPPTTFEINPVDGLTLVGDITSSVEIKDHYDELLQLNIPWVSGSVDFTQKFKLEDGIKGAVISGTIYYMACNNEACTPPAHEEFSVTFGSVTAAPAATQAEDVASVNAPANVTSVELSEWWEPVDMENDHSTEGSSWLSIFLFGFLGGLLALLTPCVWPLIPMTMSFFLKKGKNRSRSIADAVTYSVSIVVIYLVMGIAITLIFDAGKLNEIATSAVFNLIFFALLVVFAISFFGAFDITLPESWRNKMDNKAESTTGMLSIFFMAFTLVLVSFSCTGPIIGTLLVEAASQGSILGPALGMGGFALGLALPFGLFAFFPTLLKEMPQSGGWMNSVKVVLGFIELILSLKFLSVADLAYGWRILDREVFLAIWIVLFVLLGMYLLGKLRFSHDSESKHTSVLGFFLAVISFSFAVYLVPGLWGAPLKSISAFAPPLTTQDFNLYGGTFKEFDDYDEGMNYAADNNLPVIVDFSGYACVNCRKMEGAVFDTQAVRDAIENGYVLIKLMVDDKESLPTPYTVEEYGSTTRISTVGDRWSYLQRHKFGINSQPYYVLLDNQGRPLAPARAYDEDVDAFLDWLNRGAEAYKNNN
ncbi:MAG: thioredoxin family protein [Muribaculaceae bacterium]|nr:thioredoxin family protein [Muribaculaceae bacterium]